MYPDDSIMCCLFPNKCNMFPQTPGVVFENTMGYLNMMIIFTSPIFIVWSLLQVILQFVERKNDQLIDKDSFEEELSRQKEVKTESTDNECFFNDYYDADADKTCSDSNETLPINFVNRHSDLHHESNADSSSSNLNSSESVIKSTNMTNTSRNSKTSAKQDSTSSCEENNHDFKIVASIKSSLTNGRSLTVIDSCFDPEEPLMQAVRESTVDDKSKDTLPVKDMDATDQQKH